MLDLVVPTGRLQRRLRCFASGSSSVRRLENTVSHHHAVVFSGDVRNTNRILRLLDRARYVSMHQSLVRSSHSWVVHAYCDDTALRLLVQRRLFVVLQKVKEDLVSLKSTYLSTVRPVGASVNNLLTFIQQYTPHGQQRVTGEILHAVFDSTGFILEASYFKHLLSLGRDSSAAQA